MLVEVKKIGKEESVTVTSLDVAETFTYYDEETKKQYTREHKEILRIIRESIEKLEKMGDFESLYYFIESSYKDNMNRKRPMYEITKDGFTLLTMGFTDPKATKFKLGYIKQFNAMKEQLQGKYIEREKGIAIRQALTKSLQLSQENERMH